jgi:hypothetical protein
MDPAFRRMTMSGGTEASAEDPAGRDFGSFGSRARQGKEAGLTFQIRRAANRQGFGPVGEPPGTPEGLRPRRTPEDAGQGSLWLPRLETAHRERPVSADPDTKGQWGPAAMPAPITVSGGRRGLNPLCPLPSPQLA